MNGSSRLLSLVLLLALLGGLLVVAQRMAGLSGGEAGLALAGLQAPLAQGTGEWGQALRDLGRFRSLSQENRSLRDEVARLEVERQRLLALQYENDRLESLLGLRTSSFPAGLAARVAARDPNQWNSQLVFDRGSRDGVQRNRVVVASSGLVGKVISVSPSACRVRLVLDPGTAVPAMLAESGALGVVYGEDGFSCVMKFIDHDVKIREGELVLTSGLGDLYPAGIPLGRVSRGYGRTEALFQSVQVRPTVDFGNLRQALIVSKSGEPSPNPGP